MKVCLYPKAFIYINSLLF